MVAGDVKDEGAASDALGPARRPGGVRNVINEIGVTRSWDLADVARDSWITAPIRARITIDREIRVVSYGVETVNGVVHLIGIAQSRAELGRTVAHLRLKRAP